MRRQIRRFGILQTAKVLGAIYALGGLLLAPLFAIASVIGGDVSPFGLPFALLLPVMYGVLGFVMTAIGAAIYNAVASWVGGVEIELDDAGASSLT